MRPIFDDELEMIYGGESISAAVINAFVNIIKVLQNAGHDFGAAIRRIGENHICPLE